MWIKLHENIVVLKRNLSHSNRVTEAQPKRIFQPQDGCKPENNPFFLVPKEVQVFLVFIII